LVYKLGKPGVGLAVRVAGFCDLGVLSSNPVAIESTPGGVDSGCCPSESGKMSTSVLLTEGIALAAQPLPQKMVQQAVTGCP